MFSFTKNTPARMTMIARLIFGATTPGGAGPVSGRKYTRTPVGANDADVFYITFDDCYVSWTPRPTGSFEIREVNRGRVYNEYLLVAY